MRVKHIASLLVLAYYSMFAAASSVAADWPEPGRPIQMIVPAPGGSGTGDTIARVVAERLAKRLNTSIVIDNRGGANGNIGATAAARSAPTGYHLLFSWAGTLAVNPGMYKSLGFDPRNSFEPIGLVADVPNILVVNKGLPVKDFKGFVEYAEAHPGAINFASTGSGSSMHLAGELFMRETDTKLVHVPFTAPGQATTNMISGEVQAMFQLIPGILGHVRGETVRALAVMSPTRSPALPNVPTTAEIGYPQMVSSTWFALLAPKGTPSHIVDRINRELNAVLTMPEVRKQFADMGASPLGGTRQALAQHISTEMTKWAQLVKQAGIQAQ